MSRAFSSVLCAALGAFIPQFACGGPVIEAAGRDGAAVQSAISRAKPGDTVHLPAGVYSLTATLHPRSGTRLIGDGAANTILRAAFSGKPAPMIDLTHADGVELSGFTLEGAKAPIVSEAIEASDARRLLIRRLTIRDLQKGEFFGPHGIAFSANVTESLIEDCRFENIGLGAKYGGAIRFSYRSNRNAAVGNVIQETGRGGIFADNDCTDLLIAKNTITGSGGEGLGIEVWHNCARAVIEDNHIDHWLSVDSSDFTAVRRNVISDKSGSYKYCGIELVDSNHCIFTDNLVDGGQQVGLSISGNKPKDNNFFGHDRFTNAASWGAQLQGEAGGFDRNYFYRCGFFGSGRTSQPPLYAHDAGHGLRCNANVRNLTVESCEISGNSGYGIQFLGVGPKCDGFTFIDCYIHDNGGAPVVGADKAQQIVWQNCRIVRTGGDEAMPSHSDNVPPIIDAPQNGVTGKAIAFKSGMPGDVLWDFGDGPGSSDLQPAHIYPRPGKYRVTLIVWNSAGRATRSDKIIVISAPDSVAHPSAGGK